MYTYVCALVVQWLARMTMNPLTGPSSIPDEGSQWKVHSAVHPPDGAGR